MAKKFTIIMVYAIVVLSCLAMLPLIVSCTNEFEGPVEENDKLKISVESQWGDRNEIRKAIRKAAELVGPKGMKIIFATIENELAKVHLRDKNVCENTLQHDSSNIESGYDGTVTAWKALIDLVFSEIPNNHPLASSKIKNAAFFMMENAVRLIYTGITTTSCNMSSTTLTELQASQNAAARGFSNMVSNIYAVIGGSQKHNFHTAFDYHRNNTISSVVLATRNIFEGIRSLVAMISSEVESGSKDHLASFTILSKEALAYSRDWVDNVFDTIDLLFPVYSAKRI